ncbi:unnamed protein product, partial [Prunus brigantina]
MIESSLCNGPVHFDCYPDFTVSLNDPHILKTLTLNIKTSGYNVLPGTQPLALVYRIYYKVTGTNMNFQALNKSPKDQTLLIQSCTPDANIRIPHTVKWSEIALPADWTLVTESQPVPIQRSLNNLDYIRQYMDGSVRINFQHQPKSTVQLQQLPTPSPSKRHEPAPHSSASSSTTVRDLEVERDLIDLKLASLKKKDQVSHPCYNQLGDPYLPKPEPKPASPPTSPTQSDFLASELAAAHVYDIDNQISVLKRIEPFKINWKALDQHLLDPVNSSRRSIYHKIIPDSIKRNEIHQAWKDYMRTAKVEINYLDFVESRYISNEIKTLTKEKWVKLDKSEVVSSHPPAETILLHVGTKTITAAPFKIPDPTNESNKCLVEQNNYTNQSLVIVGRQLDKIETKIDKLLPSASKLRPVDKPLVQFQDLQPKFALKTSSTTKKIEEMLEQLSPLKGEKSGVKVLGSSSFAIVNSVSDSEPTTETDELSNISNIENAFKNLELESELKVKRLTNPTSLTKNWYPKPTPPDIQFEERNNLSQFSVSSDKLYEWNIDGLSEQEIMNKLTHMSMVANSYITNHSLRQSEIVPLLETGFTGTLRSWWDKHLTDESRNSIIHAVKLDEDGLPLFDTNIGRGIEDGVNTLLYTIIEHFVGTPSHTQTRIHDQLSNLRCPQLSDFRWYKDVFISRVMLREYSNQAFWKEKFINGLPNLFAHKIRTVLSNELGHIDYDNLTYGNIISIINQEGMKMCIDMKINKQIQSERKSAKYELGNFCEQYGLISTAPSRKNKSSYPSHIRKKRHYSKQRKSYRHFDESNDFYRKSRYSPKKRWSKAPRYKKDTRFSKRTDKGKSKDKSKVKCFKCQKFGHYANDCKVKDTIKQLKITDAEKDNLIKVLELRNSESSENETMVSNSESVNYESSDSQLSSPRIQLGCRDKCCNTLKKISVLTKQEEQEELLIDLISKIENPDLKSEYLRKLRKIITQETGTSHSSPVVNLNSTLERFNKKKEVSLHDLHSEVKLVKKEIVELKQLSHKLQTENYDIRQILNAFLEKEPSESNSPPGSPVHKSDKNEQSVNLIKQVNFRKWYSKVTINVKDFEFNTVALFDSGADLNCIKEGLVPTKYYKKSTESLSTASGKTLQINYEIPKAHVCQNKICFKTSFVLVKNITDKVILGLPFISMLYPFHVEFDGVVSSYLGEKIKFTFLTKPELHSLKYLHDDNLSKTITLIKDKANHLSHLQDEVKSK